MTETVPAAGSERTPSNEHEYSTTKSDEEVIDEKTNGSTAAVDDEAANYPGPLALALLMVGISAACFIVAIDRTIVSTAIPQITDRFNSPEDVGWYGSAYLLIIGLLVGFGIEFLIFIGWQAYRGDDALIPLSMLAKRTVAASFGNSFFLSGTILVHSYYLPYWFQAVRFQSAIKSGVDLVPYVASIFVFSMISGSIVTKTGWFTPPAIIGPIFTVIGCGLLTTLKIDTSTGKWVGYQILTAAGVGIGYQQGIVATQAVLPPSMISIGSNTIVFAQSLSGAIFISVGNSILRNKLSDSLAADGFSSKTIANVLAAGATNVRSLVPASQLRTLLESYNHSLKQVFIMAVPLAGLAWLTVLPMEWKNIKSKDTPGAATAGKSGGLDDEKLAKGDDSV
ncbi:MAG: hypothetical protein Q9160_003438 [Pyrenula sp. 1 TL-2023]